MNALGFLLVVFLVTLIAIFVALLYSEFVKLRAANRSVDRLLFELKKDADRLLESLLILESVRKKNDRGEE